MNDLIIRRIDGSLDGWRYYEGVEREMGKQEWCYPSNTTKLDAVYPTGHYLIKYLREQGLGGQAIFEEAGEEGTEAHIIIDKLIAGEAIATEELSEKVKRCVQSFIDWNLEFKPKFLKSEEMLVNHDLKFAGTRDLLCEISHGKYQGIYCIDYKTSNTVQEKHKIQNAGYWSCREDKTDKAAILHLGNKTTAGYSFLEYDPWPYFAQLKHFNKTFDLLYPNAAPKLVKYPDFFKL